MLYLAGFTVEDAGSTTGYLAVWADDDGAAHAGAMRLITQINTSGYEASLPPARVRLAGRPILASALGDHGYRR